MEEGGGHRNRGKQEQPEGQEEDEGLSVPQTDEDSLEEEGCVHPSPALPQGPLGAGGHVPRGEGRRAELGISLNYF